MLRKGSSDNDLLEHLKSALEKAMCLIIRKLDVTNNIIRNEHSERLTHHPCDVEFLCLEMTTSSFICEVPA